MLAIAGLFAVSALSGCELYQRMMFIGTLIRETGGVVIAGTARAGTPAGGASLAWTLRGRVDMTAMNNFSRLQAAGSPARADSVGTPAHFRTVIDPDCAVPNAACPPPQQELVSGATETRRAARTQFLASGTETSPPDLFWDRIFTMTLVPTRVPEPNRNGLIVVRGLAAYFVPKADASLTAFLDTDPLGYEIYVMQCERTVPSFVNETEQARMLADPALFADCGKRPSRAALIRLRRDYSRNPETFNNDVGDDSQLIAFLDVRETASQWQFLQIRAPYSNYSIRNLFVARSGAEWVPDSSQVSDGRSRQADQFSGSMQLQRDLQPDMARLYPSLSRTLLSATLSTEPTRVGVKKTKHLSILFGESDIMSRIYSLWAGAIHAAFLVSTPEHPVDAASVSAGEGRVREIISNARSTMLQPWTTFETEFQIESPELSRQIPHLEMMANTGILALSTAAAHVQPRNDELPE